MKAKAQKLIISKKFILKIIFNINSYILLITIVIYNNSLAEEFVSTNDIVKQIEKSLVFDKESKQKIDFYKSRENDKTSDITIEAGKSSVLTINEKNLNSGMEIVVVDNKK